ncbi:ankyrin repeat domain-containing protein [Blastopirellula retiformator]|uniref:Uncharacterized protein n=1 Tax=Blastopirellula retiformator TaxID=2527970 RepID=A0A5C5VJ19_9BACT|nr:ankyrin repeat domain-containing protein [Blastopirellula retiformator]TWT38644.1 hypothetical protein Enr8_03370 [Blastopirellula retiformator]
MRNLLLLLAVPASLAGYYLWRLRPSEVDWTGLTGIALMALTVIFWSAVLQIAWRDKEDRPDSPSDQPESPSGFEKRRMVVAGLFAMLAIPTMVGGLVWASHFGPQNFHAFQQGLQWDQLALAMRNSELQESIPTSDLRRLPIGLRKAGYRQTDIIDQIRAADAMLVTHTDETETVSLISKIRSGDETAVQALLDSGVDVNIPDPDSGLRPLDEASRCGNPAIIELLKQHGARRSPDA